MESSQFKTSANGGMEVGGGERQVSVGKKRTIKACDVVLRIFALAFALTAAVLLGVNKQTKLVPMTVVPTLPPVNIPVTSKWHYMPAFVFFVVANAIACGYAALSLLLTLTNMNAKKGIAMMIVFLDLVMLGLIFSAVGAACSVGLLGYNGNSHVQWNKVCNIFDKFCAQAAASVVISGVAGAAFLFLVLLAFFNLHKRC